VPVDRLLTQEEPLGDGLVRLARSDEPEHLELTRSEPVLGRLGRLLTVEGHDVRSSPETLEHLARRLALETGPFFVAERAARPRQRQADSRRDVRRAHALPRFERTAKRSERRGGVPFGEQNRASRVRGHGGEHLRVVARRDHAELRARLLGVLGVTCGEEDLDQRRQEFHSLERIRRLPSDAPNGRLGRTELSLSETQERKTRLRFSAELTRAAVEVFGRLKIAAEPFDLGLLVDCISRVPGLDSPREPRRRAPGLQGGLLPRAPELQDLRSVSDAGSCERHELGLRVAPFRERRGPFPRAVERVDPVAVRDRHTVDEPRDGGRELAGCCREHGFV
jgi:hypothetical protein